jgi:ribosomal protein S18 acetylase RimI-like enzyme
MVKEHATQLHIHLLRPWEILAYKRVMKQLSKVSYERVPPPHLNILEKIVNTIESAVSSYLRNDRIYVIKEKKVIGGAHLREVQRGVWYLLSIIIDKRSQSKGIGKALLGHIIHDLKKKGGKKLLLDTHPQLEQAKGFYKKMGFEQVCVNETVRIKTRQETTTGQRVSPKDILTSLSTLERVPSLDFFEPSHFLFPKIGFSVHRYSNRRIFLSCNASEEWGRESVLSHTSRT